MNRGFVTIATGIENYYRIARNLLRSYRFFSDDPMPFALICDRENDYSREFDRVILIDDPYGSYVDKLRLPELCPFDETIFIDADCLAYKDLNDFWGVFENGPDFSAFGKNYPAEYEYAWFRLDDAGEYAGLISSIPDFVGGVYFMRKTPHLSAFSETCRHILDNYHTFKFRQFIDPADEPIFALAMSVHGDTTAGERSLPVCFYPHAFNFKADLLHGTTFFDSRFAPEEGMMNDAYMVHWGAGNTGKYTYCVEECKLNRMIKGKKAGKAVLLAGSVWMWSKFQAGRVMRRARRMLHK